MLKLKISPCIIRGGKYSNIPAISCECFAGMSSSGEKWASRIIEKLYKTVSSRFVYFWKGDPFLFPDHDFALLIQILRKNKFFIITETPGVVKGGYGLVDHLIQVADFETARTHFIERNELVILVTENSTLTSEQLLLMKGGLSFIHIRPAKPDQLSMAVDIACKTAHSKLHLPPLLLSSTKK